MIIDLNWNLLVNFVNKHKQSIEAIFVGIDNNWENTSDEVYCREFGWLDDNKACSRINPREGFPVAYIHYNDDKSNKIDEFKFFRCIE